MPVTVRQPTDAERAEAAAWPVWNCEPSIFEWGYAQTERCLLLEGEAMVEARGQTFNFKAGDFVVFPKGLACRWHVVTAVKKHFTFDGD